MASTVITAPELHEETETVIRSKLLEYVPMFRQHMDRGAGDLIGNLESIIQHKLWQRVGYDSMEAYARDHLLHSEQWCHEVIRIYRQDWSREQKARGTVGDLHRDYSKLVPATEPARKPGAPEGTVNNPAGLGGKSGKKADIDKSENYAFNKEARKPKPGKGNADPERVIARLKRDKADEGQPAEVRQKAGFLLAGIERGEVKPHGAAKAMGYVKPPDPAAIVEKQRQQLPVEVQARLWEEWGRSLQDEIDRYRMAEELFQNMTEHEQSRFLKWARGWLKQAA